MCALCLKERNPLKFNIIKLSTKVFFIVKIPGWTTIDLKATEEINKIGGKLKKIVGAVSGCTNNVITFKEQQKLINLCNN